MSTSREKTRTATMKRASVLYVAFSCPAIIGANMPSTLRPFAIPAIVTLVAIAAYGQTSAAPYTWTPVIPALAVARADACAAALPDGSAIITGGVGVDGSALSSVEIFQLGIFSSAPAMNTARAAHTCTVLTDGRILVAGGNDGHGNPIGTAEIYDPIAQ